MKKTGRRIISLATVAVIAAISVVGCSGGEIQLERQRYPAQKNRVV